jgi:transposase
LQRIGKAEAFEYSRDLAAWLGVVPRQSTTGGKPKLFGISKQGYLRKLLIRGAQTSGVAGYDGAVAFDRCHRK